MKESGLPFDDHLEAKDAMELLDLNKDGYLSLTEYMTYWMKRRSYMKEKQSSKIDAEVAEAIQELGICWEGFHSALQTICGRLCHPQKDILLQYVFLP